MGDCGNCESLARENAELQNKIEELNKIIEKLEKENEDHIREIDRLEMKIDDWEDNFKRIANLNPF